MLAGVFLGLVVTIRTLDGGARTVAAGPWQGAPRDGTFDVDPYTLAADERSGVLPLGVAEGLSFVARTDSEGRAFAASCDYVVKGPMPQARFWTLSLLDPAGFAVRRSGRALRLHLGGGPARRRRPVAITESRPRRAAATGCRPAGWAPTS